MKQYIKMFKNDNKQEGDSKPVYQNSNVKIQNKFLLDPDRTYSCAIWNNDDGTLNLKLELKDEQYNQSPDI